MILNAYMELENTPLRYILHHTLQDLRGNAVITGDNRDVTAYVTMHIGGKDYKLGKVPAMMEKASFPFFLPLDNNRKKTLGYKFTSDGTDTLLCYKEAATYGKLLIFKKNFAFSVYQFQGSVYHCFRVGFPEDNCHYYCLKTPEGETLAVIQRHMWDSVTGNDCRATLYLKDPTFLKLAALVCANEIMTVEYLPDDDEKFEDDSAGHYISLSQEEKSMFDKDFISAVKALDGIID